MRDWEESYVRVSYKERGMTIERIVYISDIPIERVKEIINTL